MPGHNIKRGKKNYITNAILGKNYCRQFKLPAIDIKRDR
jgi:hypothetical protein